MDRLNDIFSLILIYIITMGACGGKARNPTNKPENPGG